MASRQLSEQNSFPGSARQVHRGFAHDFSAMVRSSLHRCSNATQQDYWTAASAVTTHIANASNLLLPTPDPATSYLDEDLESFKISLRA